MLNVLIPTDFSANAGKAIEYAIMLFGSNTRYTLVHGFEVPHSGATMLISIADILEKDALHALNKTRDELLKARPELEDKVDIRAEMGSPSVAVRKLAQTGEFDLVVMGTKGASGLKEVFVGSVASNVLSDVTIPVIAVPNDARLELPANILFAADDQCLVLGKLPKQLVDLSNRLGAEVMVLNVVPEGEIGHVGSSSDQKDRPDGAFEGVKHSLHFIEDEDVNHGIQKFLENHKVDVLAMVTRRDDLLSKLFGVSNTKSMMMHSHIPLFAFH